VARRREVRLEGVAWGGREGIIEGLRSRAYHGERGVRSFIHPSIQRLDFNSYRYFVCFLWSESRGARMHTTTSLYTFFPLHFVSTPTLDAIVSSHWQYHSTSEFNWNFFLIRIFGYRWLVSRKSHSTEIRAHDTVHHVVDTATCNAEISPDRDRNRITQIR